MTGGTVYLLYGVHVQFYIFILYSLPTNVYFTYKMLCTLYMNLYMYVSILVFCTFVHIYVVHSTHLFNV